MKSVPMTELTKFSMTLEVIDAPEAAVTCQADERSALCRLSRRGFGGCVIELVDFRWEGHGKIKGRIWRRQWVDSIEQHDHD